MDHFLSRCSCQEKENIRTFLTSAGHQSCVIKASPDAKLAWVKPSKSILWKAWKEFFHFPQPDATLIGTHQPQPPTAAQSQHHIPSGISRPAQVQPGGQQGCVRTLHYAWRFSPLMDKPCCTLVEVCHPLQSDTVVSSLTIFSQAHPFEGSRGMQESRGGEFRCWCGCFWRKVS